MNMKKRGLGKGLSDLGLSALLGDLKKPATAIEDLVAPVAIASAKPVEQRVDGELRKLPVHVLKPGKYQPRRFIAPEALEELANSIRTQGVIQPIIVRPLPNNQYEIIAGERRWRAAQLAGLEYVPAVIRDIPDETAMLLALIENIQRRDLNVMEEALALNRLAIEFEMTHQAIADAVGKSRENVTNLLRLLKLTHAVRKLVEENKIEMGHARALLTLDEEKQTAVAQLILSKQLSVRETEDHVRKMMDDQSASSPTSNRKIVLHTLQDRLSQKFNATVSVMQNAKGRGKLTIHYRSEDELQKILNQINRP